MLKRMPKSKISIVKWFDGKYSIDKNVNALNYFIEKRLLLLGFEGLYKPGKLLEKFIDYSESDEYWHSKVEGMTAVSTNDAFVMQRFANTRKCFIDFISDGSGKLTRELGLADMSLIVSTPPFLALVNNGDIEQLEMVDEKTLPKKMFQFSNS